MYKKIVQTILFLAVLLSTKSFAVDETTKNIILPYNTPHIFIFDDEITDYKFEKEKMFKAEFPASIFDDKQKLLIIPVKNIDNKLTVKTETGIYNFLIKFTETKKITVENSNSGGWLSNFLLSIQNRNVSEEYELDSPPLLSENECGATSFDLDIPPKLSASQLNHGE